MSCEDGLTGWRTPFGNHQQSIRVIDLCGRPTDGEGRNQVFPPHHRPTTVDELLYLVRFRKNIFRVHTKMSFSISPCVPCRFSLCQCQSFPTVLYANLTSLGRHIGFLRNNWNMSRQISQYSSFLEPGNIKLGQIKFPLFSMF